MHVGAHIVGVGIDAVDVQRFRRSLERTPTMRTRLFTDAELAYATRRNDPTEPLAARFAAKEAVMKAMGVGIGACAMRDIEVERASSGEPTVVLHGRAAELSAERSIEIWRISLTHTAITAMAFAVAVTGG